MDTLLHLSGGLDSVYVAWRWMKDHPDETLLMHHIHLHHPKENRIEQESDAVTAVIEWFVDNDMSNFVYEESWFDYGTLNRKFVKDVRIISIFTGIILSHYPGIKNYLRTRHKGETDTPVPMGERMIMRAIRGIGIRGNLNFIYVNIDKTRKDMKDEMPADLYKLAHCCRKPVNGKPCRKCHTCRQFLDEGLDPL